MATKKPAKKAAKVAADVRLGKLQKELGALIQEPEFKQMTQALKRSLSQRVSVEGAGKKAGVFETALAPDKVRPYYNIYRYRFW